MKWQRIVSSDRLEPKEKLNQIKLEASKLEEKAKRIEQLSRYDRTPKEYGVGINEYWIDDTMQVNDLLVDAIKAKLEVLSNL